MVSKCLSIETMIPLKECFDMCLLLQVSLTLKRLMSIKWSNTHQKSCSTYCNIFIMRLTIVWTPDLIGSYFRKTRRSGSNYKFSSLSTIAEIHLQNVYNCWFMSTRQSSLWTMTMGLENVIKGTLSGLTQFLAAERSFKMMKNAFYFVLKALFNLKVFKFMSWLLDHA